MSLKRSTLFLALFICSLCTRLPAYAQYDKALADSLHADEYGMKMYVLVILRSGPTKIMDGKVRDSFFAGHMANIKYLSSIGKMTVAGPLEDNDKQYRGIFILNVKTIDDAKALLQNDPTIKSGIFDVELYNWYGAAALPMYLPYYDKTCKKKF